MFDSLIVPWGYIVYGCVGPLGSGNEVSDAGVVDDVATLAVLATRTFCVYIW